MHARGLAGDLGGAAQRPADRRGKFFTRRKFGFSFHCDLANNFGARPELSLESPITSNRSSIVAAAEERSDLVVIAEERNVKLGASVLEDKSEIAVAAAFEKLAS